jgi:hypothetical protein
VHRLAVGKRIDIDLDGIAQYRSISTGASPATRTAASTYASSWAAVSTISMARPPST